ncbi:MAG: hypothetical protein K2I64_04020 [Muribaculaceae bacterium]|nr:hypothetical protein [Muribaculaceae bacterium]
MNNDCSKEEILDKLIKEGEKFEIIRIPQHVGFQNGCLVEFSPSVKVNDMSGLTSWIQNCTRFLGIYYPNDIAYIKFQQINITDLLNPDLKVLVGLLKAIRQFPSMCQPQNSQNSTLVSVVNTQNQNQTQSQNIEFVLEHLNEDFTDEQIEQIREIINSNSPKGTKRSKMLDLLQNFGVSIGANLLTSLFIGK